MELVSPGRPQDANHVVDQIAEVVIHITCDLSLTTRVEPDEYVVEVQNNNPMYLGGSMKFEHKIPVDNPTTGTTFDSVCDSEPDQVDPLKIEMDVETYHKQIRELDAIDAHDDNSPREETD